MGVLPGNTLVFEFQHSYGKMPTRWHEVTNDHGAIVGWTWLTDERLTVVDAQGELAFRVEPLDSEFGIGYHYPVYGSNDQIVGWNGMHYGVRSNPCPGTADPVKNLVKKAPVIARIKPRTFSPTHTNVVDPGGTLLATISHVPKPGKRRPRFSPNWRLDLCSACSAEPLRTLVTAATFVRSFGWRGEE